MRRTGHIRERSSGTFELRYLLGTDLASGKRRYATATAFRHPIMGESVVADERKDQES